MKKLIINQDKEWVKVRKCNVRIKKVVWKEQTIAFNIMYNRKILGTFNTYLECYEEFANILNDDSEMYYVKVY